LEEDKDREEPDISDIVNLKIFGIDFGRLIRKWTGVTDINSLIEKPEQIEQVKQRVEEQRAKLRETQEKLRNKYGGAIRFDYDIRIGSLGDREGIRIGGGEYFQRLDKLSTERELGKGPRGTHPRSMETIDDKESLREPLTDVSEREDHLYVTAELPGAEKKDISIEIAEDKVTISANAPNRKYHTEITLPTNVELSPVEQSYRNGVLEVKLKKHA